MTATPKRPEHVRNFFIYNRVWQDVYTHNKNAAFIVIGQTGSGKSYVAQRIAIDLDPSFNIEERVVYTAEDFLVLLASGKVKRGNVIVFDELTHEEGADSRSSLSRSNKILSYVASTYRTLGLIVIFVLPSLTQLDKNLRAISVTGVFRTQSIDFKRKLCRCKFYWNDLNPMMGKAYLKTPIVTHDGETHKVKYVLFGRPPKYLTLAYERKKLAFIREHLVKWRDEFVGTNSVSDNSHIRNKGRFDLLLSVETVKKDKKQFEVDGRIIPALIASKLNIGLSRAREVARLCR